MGAWKTGVELAQGGLPQFLRELADALEAGSGAGHFQGLPAAGCSVNGLRKLVLVAECTSAGLSVKLKAKRSGEVRVPTRSAHDRTAEGAGRHPSTDKDKDMSSDNAKDKASDKAKNLAAREKYRQLKKSMQQDFKALQKCAAEGRQPEAETLESFLCLAELMAQGEQPLGGAALAEMSQANATFLDDCQALRRACSARDTAALADVLERLGRRKSACHAQFR